MVKTDDALAILQHMTVNDPEMEEMIKDASLNAELAQLIYQVRIQAGLTQQQLANRVGTQQSVIARLEDAEYEGHSLSMLQRIARALNRRVAIQLIPLAEEPLNVA